ncbi:MAG: chromate transporter [Mogibacterium sp.]|nr:chromate transporter [Mogibacterium sp.]
MIHLKLFWAFFKIGALGFGGGMAIISMIYDNIRQFVPITASQYADIVAIAQVTPGPVAVNTATYVGYETAGLLGSLSATLGVAMPAFILVAIIASMVERYKRSRIVAGALEGIRPATVGMVASAVLTVGVPALFTAAPLGANFAAGGVQLPGGIDLFSLLICAATVLLIGKFKVGTFRVLILMGILGAVLGV